MHLSHKIQLKHEIFGPVSDYCFLQSLIDLAVSFVLLLTTLTIKDHFKIHNNGILGWMECRLWNTKSLLWGLFKSSTWNLVALTFER